MLWWCVVVVYMLWIGGSARRTQQERVMEETKPLLPRRAPQPASRAKGKWKVGQQCTLPREYAVAACMAMPGCVAVTCPEPAESHIGTRGITGPVCQLRSSRTPNERGHGMCKPRGCVNVALSRIRRPHELHEWRALGGVPSPTTSDSRSEPPSPMALLVHLGLGLVHVILVLVLGEE